MRPSLFLLSTLLCAACAAPVEPTDPEGGEGESGGGAGVVEPPVDDGGMCEDIDEAQCALNACSAACYAVELLGCGTVIALCLGGDFVSAGGATVPCYFALGAACGVFAGSALENCARLCS